MNALKVDFLPSGGRMYKISGGALALLTLIACVKDNNPRAVPLAGGAVTLYVYDSVAHGSGDLRVARDSLAHGSGDLTALDPTIVLTPVASSTPSKNAKCTLNVVHDTSAGSSGEIRITASC
jgi:hypothetical protein